MMGSRLLPPLFLCLAAVVGACVFGACTGATAEGGGAAAGGDLVDLVVRRGDLQERLLVTGELVAQRAEPLDVPRTREFQLQIRWLAEDGTAVRAGQPVVEFDNSAFASDLEEKKLGAFQADNELARMRAEGESTLAEKSFAVEEKKTELAKAKTAAAVPRDLLTLRDWQEKQSARRRAEVQLEKAERDLAAYRQAHVADLEVKRIEIDRSRREIAEAERAIDILTVRAPRDGIVLAGEHPWEGRKFQEGDTAFPGMTVASLPDLRSMRVEASLPDVDDGRVTAGMRVMCYLDAFPSLAFPGRVVDIASVAREANGNSLRRYFAMKVDLDRLDLQRMRPGMSVRVEVRGRQVKGALLAPRAALDLSASPARALLAAGGTAPVRLRLCDAGTCAIEGMNEGMNEGMTGGIAAGTRLRSAFSGNAGGSAE